MAVQIAKREIKYLGQITIGGQQFAEVLSTDGIFSYLVEQDQNGGGVSCNCKHYVCNKGAVICKHMKLVTSLAGKKEEAPAAKPEASFDQIKQRMMSAPSRKLSNGGTLMEWGRQKMQAAPLGSSRPFSILR